MNGNEYLALYTVLTALIVSLVWAIGFLFMSWRKEEVEGVQITDMGCFRHCKKCHWTPEPMMNTWKEAYTGCFCKKCGGEIQMGRGRVVYRFIDKNQMAEGAPRYEMTCATFFRDGIVVLDEFPGLVLVSPKQIISGTTKCKKKREHGQ